MNSTKGAVVGELLTQKDTTAIKRYKNRGIRNEEFALSIQKISKSLKKLSINKPTEPVYKYIIEDNSKLIFATSIAGGLFSLFGGFTLGVTSSPAFFALISMFYPCYVFGTATEINFSKTHFLWTRKMRKNLRDNLALKTQYELDCEEHKQKIARVIEKLAPQLRLLNEKHMTSEFSINPETGKLVIVNKLHKEIEFIEKFIGVE